MESVRLSSSAEGLNDSQIFYRITLERGFTVPFAGRTSHGKQANSMRMPVDIGPIRRGMVQVQR